MCMRSFLCRAAFSVPSRAVSTSAAMLSPSAAAAPFPRLTEASMNSHARSAQYAVRGEIVLRALAIAEELRAAKHTRSFSKLYFCNIGNPHELGQVPITFFRQVLALTDYPDLLKHPMASSIFPADVMARAQTYLSKISGGTGAYTNSQGLSVIREEVATFITKRDKGVVANVADIYLTDGASPAVQAVIRMLLSETQDAIMIPIPQYPLYSASLALYGGKQVGYCLDETKGWSTGSAEIKRSYAAATAEGKVVKAIAVINPGNPTGNVLSKESMMDVLQFAHEKSLVVLADEVYQENVWGRDKGRVWHSFKAVAAEMGLIQPSRSNEFHGLQLASFQSTSKGFTGECGRRGGYMELVGFDDTFRAQAYKLASISLCANVGGQIMMGLQCNPPQAGSPSHPLYTSEKEGILASLERRASILVNTMRGMEGVTCEDPQGALYVFPRIRLPPAALRAAKEAGKAADAFYCLQLLEETGIVLVPGSGFGQEEGTLHFRSTVLPSEAEMGKVVKLFKDFHARFMHKYRQTKE